MLEWKPDITQCMLEVSIHFPYPRLESGIPEAFKAKLFSEALNEARIQLGEELPVALASRAVEYKYIDWSTAKVMNFVGVKSNGRLNVKSLKMSVRYNA